MIKNPRWEYEAHWKSHQSAQFAQIFHVLAL